MHAWQPYRPRTVRAAEILNLAGWRLKTYEITLDDCAIEREDFATGAGRAAALLPQPPSNENRAGAGFLIFHSGASHHYLVCGWWDTQNELFIRTLARPRERDQWDESGARHSICVWDLDVIWFERNAWVECVMSSAATSVSAGVERYLALMRPNGPSRSH